MPAARAPPLVGHADCQRGQCIFLTPSPDLRRLGSREELLAHLTAAGTCKCGLQCPFRLEEKFNFDPAVLGLPDHPSHSDGASKPPCRVHSSSLTLGSESYTTLSPGGTSQKASRSKVVKPAAVGQGSGSRVAESVAPAKRVEMDVKKLLRAAKPAMPTMQLHLATPTTLSHFLQCSEGSLQPGHPLSALQGMKVGAVLSSLKDQESSCGPATVGVCWEAAGAPEGQSTSSTVTLRDIEKTLPSLMACVREAQQLQHKEEEEKRRVLTSCGAVEQPDGGGEGLQVSIRLAGASGGMGSAGRAEVATPAFEDTNCLTQDEPDPCSGEPDLTSGEPDPCSRGPNLSSGEPDPCSVGPNLSSGEPDPCGGEPDLSSGEPDPCGGEPDLSSGEPDPCIEEDSSTTLNASNSSLHSSKVSPGGEAEDPTTLLASRQEERPAAGMEVGVCSEQQSNSSANSDPSLTCDPVHTQGGIYTGVDGASSQVAVAPITSLSQSPLKLQLAITRVQSSLLPLGMPALGSSPQKQPEGTASSQTNDLAGADQSPTAMQAGCDAGHHPYELHATPPPSLTPPPPLHRPKSLTVSVPLSAVCLTHHSLLECWHPGAFFPGDIVWAKAPLLPAWPGVVISHADWKQDKLDPAPDGMV